MNNYKFSFRLFIAFSLIAMAAYSQQTFPVNGVHDNRQLYYAFTNARIYAGGNAFVDDATLLIRNGLIIDAGKNVTIPPGSVITDLKGKSIFPSLIDIYSSYGISQIPETKKKPRHHDGAPQMERRSRGSFSWNEALKPETEAVKLFQYDKTAAEKLRQLGFGAVLSHRKDGIARGTGVLAAPGEGKENELVIKERASAHYSLQKGSSKQDYPSSLMGNIALLRQAYLDAQWYKTTYTENRNNPSPNPTIEKNISLEALNTLLDLPQIIEAGNKNNALRTDKIGDEFGIRYIIKANDDGYQRINEMKATGASFILSLNFPKPYNVADPYDALDVSLADMKHWEMAPANAAIFEKNNIPFALTAGDMTENGDFFKNIRKAIAHGLSPERAFKALTTEPAKMLGMEKSLGALKKGMIANFIITSYGLHFFDETIIFENWILGKQYIINDLETRDVRGDYNLTFDDAIYKINVNGKLLKPKGEIVIADIPKIKADISLNGKFITISFDLSSIITSKVKEGHNTFIRLSGVVVEDTMTSPNFSRMRWKGKGQIAGGQWIEWSAIQSSAFSDSAKKETLPETGVLYFPNMAYGWDALPEAGNVLLKNATVWTNEKEGVLKETDVLISGGKISAIGKALDPKGAPVIDATGMHLTAGIIDEHSHIAIEGGVNEGGQAVSAEVRIGDVVNGDDINIYRQLAGGVTAAQLLHGSANPVGGQSSLVKLRWGQSPEEMKIKGADGFIKFALGENVKQAHWGDKFKVRFPQTRMGVEQVYYDLFHAAREYGAEWKRYNSLSSKEKVKATAPRKDLELETIWEILEKKRFISCHSYRQSEINMLIHVADSMGFKVNTFTHILEGYKVADKIKKHGAGASTFSDWWAYKIEVEDAIPYNGAILHEQGVVTAFNSDNAEMARRLNQEAAKAVKYGNVSEEEALKFVTLNPAKLLHLDSRMGSIKVGKDADLVLWTENPLSSYARVVRTYVDGICYYDDERDKQLREAMKKERARLIAKMMREKKN